MHPNNKFERNGIKKKLSIITNLESHYSIMIPI